MGSKPQATSRQQPADPPHPQENAINTTQTAAQTAAQPRDDFYRICGVAAAMILAVVLVVAAPVGRPLDTTLAAATDASSQAVSLMAGTMEGDRLVAGILRGETQAYGY